MTTSNIKSSIKSNDLLTLFEKYRSTSNSRFIFYPKSEKWNHQISKVQLIQKLENYSEPTFDLYIHVPFCSSFCTFCGCNIKTSKSIEDENDFYDSLMYELKFYSKYLKSKKLKNLYIGGGTPTYLNNQKLESLFQEIFKRFPKDKLFEGFIESTPYNLNQENLQILKNFKIENIKVGIQDLDPTVLQNINRAHQMESIDSFLNLQKQFKFLLHIELVAGLPHQSCQQFLKTVDIISKWNIETLTIYPLAKREKNIKLQNDLGFLPISTNEKLQILSHANTFLLNKGFQSLGFDCFKSPNTQKKYLKRSTFGFTDSKSELLVGIGPSSISSGSNFLRRNEKILEKYSHLCKTDNLFNQMDGHLLNHQEILKKSKISLIIDQKDEINQQFLEEINNLDSLFINENQMSQLGRLFLSSILENIIK